MAGWSQPFSRLKAAMLDGVACVYRGWPGPRPPGSSAGFSPKTMIVTRMQHHQRLRGPADQEPGHRAAPARTAGAAPWPGSSYTVVAADHLVKYQFSGVRLSIGLCGRVPCSVVEVSEIW